MTDDGSKKHTSLIWTRLLLTHAIAGFIVSCITAILFFTGIMSLKNPVAAIIINIAVVIAAVSSSICIAFYGSSLVRHSKRKSFCAAAPIE